SQERTAETGRIAEASGACGTEKTGAESGIGAGRPGGSGSKGRPCRLSGDSGKSGSFQRLSDGSGGQRRLSGGEREKRTRGKGTEDSQSAGTAETVRKRNGGDANPAVSEESAR